MIDKIGGVSPGYGPKKTEPSAKTESTRKVSDNVTISREASQAAELDKLVKTVKGSDDTSRTERLKEVKEKLARGDYDNLGDETLSRMADNIMATFFR